MMTLVRFIAPLLLLLCAIPLANGMTESIQLPFVLASKMSGVWSLEVHTPCEPYIVAGTLKFVNDTVAVQWLHNAPLSPILDVASSEETVALDASGLRAFSGGTQEQAPLSYTLCGAQANTIVTPDRPNFEKKMEETELTVYTGSLAASGDEEKTCQSGTSDVLIRTLGSDIRGFKSTHWKVKESLQYVELHFDSGKLTKHCVAEGEGTGARQESTQTATKVGKGRRHRGGAFAASSGALEGTRDQSARQGSIIIRLARQTPPSKSFYERYYPTLLFGGIMIAYRAVYGFTSYRALKG
ncbi:hypothetical protein DQ04_03281090 [Trypanosoma grayi]|uniref:hypothetical protein n=1 Tax=Trypanosoma grayi TaxID=71804 RepID=UPI0004F4AB0A|nr:hypothetical protein DQ04_03281090 [Trypanosoma grayi]KEG10806.1 hypothetical protein DQ04_03281090 [Trypanosoma grayi]